MSAFVICVFICSTIGDTDIIDYLQCKSTIQVTFMPLAIEKQIGSHCSRI